MLNLRRSGWVVRGGTEEDGWGLHLAFVLGTVLAIPAFGALVVVATQTSGVARFGAVVGAVALGLLILWTVALSAFVVALARRLRSRS